MAKPIALIKINRLITPEELAKIERKMEKHTISADYHILLVPCLDNGDVTLETHNDENATETTVEELRQQIKSLINESK